ncbi:siderophore-iron reductase FhuF [Aquabacter sediminis]|uniref:siderophore-iron reductase FhuF n=1 Tax=Aquabacter sediminis TaxID=3029197 RepID=UPI00237EDF96|nr:siderophore-iron reductase FhuF [Aquabacter sp. P-9]MDE1571166.1 siderophore-iron reductase FhuF [Aquabacter sp. P-9]
MIAALAPLFRGPLAPYAEALRLETDSAAHPGSVLSDPPFLTAQTRLFARRFAQPERRAVASLWMKHHVSAVLTPVLAANLLLGRQMPVALEEIQVLPGPDGIAKALILRHPGTPISRDDPHARFAPLLEGHVAPLVKALAKASGIAPKVLWSNVGNWFDGLVGEAEAMGAEGVGEARALLALERAPDGTRNPLFAAVRHTREGRKRRVCCLRYLIPELDLCDTCPLPHPVRP